MKATQRTAVSACVPLVVLALMGCDTAGPGPESKTAPEEGAVRVLAAGGPFHMTNGIHFGPDGLLWMASVMTPVLAALDPETGEVRKSYGPEDGIKGPDDLAFGPGGTMCWTDIMYGEVGCMSPEGEVTLAGSPGPGVNPITFSDDGRLFVAQCFMGDELFEVDPKGEKEQRLISDRLGPNCGLNGMDWGDDGKLYGPRWFQHEVVRFDVDSGEFETVADGFEVPAAVKFDSQGRLHVLDSLKGEVVRVDVDTGARETVARLGPGLDNLAFTSDDRLFVSSFADGFIVEVLDGENTREVVRGGINMPGGLAVIEREGKALLLVADFFALRMLDGESGQQLGATRDVIGFSDLGSVMTVAPFGDGVVLTSWFDNAVKLWNPDRDELVGSFTGFAQPVHAIAFGADLVVSEHGNGAVVRFNPETPEQRSTIVSGLAEPAGLLASGRDLYVAERSNGEILQILADGEPVKPARVVAGGLEGPEGLALSDGGLFVVEADAGRVSRVDLEDGSKTTVAEGLALHIETQPGFPSTMVFNGIAVAGNRAYVSADRTNEIYVFEF